MSSINCPLVIFGSRKKDIINKIRQEFNSCNSPELIKLYHPLPDFFQILEDSFSSEKSKTDSINKIYQFFQKNISPPPMDITIKGIKIIKNIYLDHYITEIDKNTLIEFISFFEDIETKIVDTELLWSKNNQLFCKKIIKNHKMALIGKLSGHIAHEYNNLLTIIKNWAQLGLIEKDDDIRNKALNIILKSSERSSELTKSLLHFYRRMTPEKEQININELVDNLLISIRKKISKDEIKIEKNFNDVPLITGDRFTLNEALFNLFLNASDALKEKEKKITIITSEEDKYVKISFIDTGEGIPEKNKRKIFEPFFSTREIDDLNNAVTTGIGLGLTIADNIIKIHNGKIEIESNENKGSQVTVYLPIKSMSGSEQNVFN